MTIALAGDDDKVDFPLYLLALGAITKAKGGRKGFSNWQQLWELPANRIASFLCKEYRKLRDLQGVNRAYISNRLAKDLAIFMGYLCNTLVTCAPWVSKHASTHSHTHTPTQLPAHSHGVGNVRAPGQVEFRLHRFDFHIDLYNANDRIA